MKLYRPLSLVLALGAMFTLELPILRGQSLEPSKIDVSRLGPQVGERVPDFSLLDQNGDVWTRDSIMGNKGAMLVFVRSADW